MGISFLRTFVILTASAIMAAIIAPSNGPGVMARTIPASALDQLDLYLPEKTLMMAKKSATALNRLMLALRSYDKNSVEKSGHDGADANSNGKSNGGTYDTLNMQRRNQKDRKIYLRCYFNAVSCF